jgi:4-aminobutyrate aminotransferase-like enzyme
MIKHRMIYSPYLEWSFDFARAEGDFIWTTDGTKLIDFTSGWNTTNLGWNHPEVAAAMIAQIGKNTYTPMWSADEAQREYARVLTDALPPGLTAIGRGTGGTEANEMAIKTARAFTGRTKIIGFQETYHGQSTCTMAIGMPGAFVLDICPRQFRLYPNRIPAKLQDRSFS